MKTIPALPEALPRLLKEWYEKNARDLPWRHDREPYHIWLSEIMLQQTRVEAVKGYYTRFLESCPTIAALAEAPPELVQKLWEGLGYYSRVRNLQAAAQKIMAEHDGEFPKDYDAVRALPGIGPYTAGAIMSIAYDAPTPAVDGNVLRVLTRLLAWDASISQEKTKRAAEAALKEIYPPEAGMFTQSLMELGATVCLPNGEPKCSECPLKALCRAGQEGTWQQYPVKERKKDRRIEDRTVLVLRCDGHQAVRKRPKKGLLADLWEYPNVEGTLSAAEALTLAEQWGCEPASLTMQLDRVHIFTHVQWNLRCYYIECRKMTPEFTWASAQMLKSEIALPTAFRMFFLE
ncbi:MAG: A/G-specific adenine glycosylase [Ruminococcaceae bacterium]|nr:A/G-specific adenine glycosylase [Oscillospiraceae bacterium]